MWFFIINFLIIKNDIFIICIIKIDDGMINSCFFIIWFIYKWESFFFVDKEVSIFNCDKFFIFFIEGNF